jgi:hypothetical protein
MEDGLKDPGYSSIFLNANNLFTPLVIHQVEATYYDDLMMLFFFNIFLLFFHVYFTFLLKLKQWPKLKDIFLSITLLFW